MTRYIVDTPNENMRNWKEIDDQLVAATMGRNPDEVRSRDTTVTDGIILVHRRVLGRSIDQNYLERVCSPTLTIVIVSGTPQEERELLSGRVYCRRVPVDIPTDPVFARCWKAFLHQREKGLNDFSLLEPSAVNSVVALKLLAQLAQFKIRRGDPDDEPTRSNWWWRGSGASSEQEFKKALVEDVGPTAADRIVNGLARTLADPRGRIDSFVKFVSATINTHRIGGST